MNLEDFKNLADSVQSLVVALGVLIGGAWALFRFGTLKEIDKARAELQKAKRDLQERGPLKLLLKAVQIKPPDDITYCINVILNVTNVGNRTETVSLNDSKIGAARVMLTPDGVMNLGPPFLAQRHGVFMVTDASTVDPGNSEDFSFLVPVDSKGLYCIEALLAGSPDETTTAVQAVKQAGIESTFKVVGWSARMYFYVSDNGDVKPNAQIS